MDDKIKIYPSHKYRCDVYIDDVLLDLDAFIGLHESWNFRENLYVLRVLMINVRASFMTALGFLETNTCKITLKMIQISKSDDNITKGAANYFYEEEELYTVEYTGIIDHEVFPFSDEDIQKHVNNNDDDKMRYMIRFHLTCEEEHPFTQNVFNCVLNEDTDPQNIIAAAFLDCAVEDLKIYIDPPQEGIKIPKGTIFKPMGFLQLMDKLQEDFTIYPFGYNVFIEEDCVYVLSNDGCVDVDSTYEPSWIVTAANPLSHTNMISKGLRSGYGNNIVVSTLDIVVDDSKNIRYKNTKSRITESGELIHPATTNRNISYFVDNDEFVSDNISRNDKNIRMQNISVVCDKTYIDVWGHDKIQIESPYYTMNNLTIRSMKRIITPLGCVTNLILMRKIVEEQ